MAASPSAARYSGSSTARANKGKRKTIFPLQAEDPSSDYVGRRDPSEGRQVGIRSDPLLPDKAAPSAHVLSRREIGRTLEEFIPKGSFTQAIRKVDDCFGRVIDTLQKGGEIMGGGG